MMNGNAQNPSSRAGGLNLPPEQMNALLAMAGKQLGRNPEQLRAQLESGQLGKAFGGLDAQKTAQINQLLSNPRQLEMLLSSPQVKNMINGLMNRK